MDIESLTKAIEESPSSYQLYMDRGMLYYKAANMSASYNDFTKVLELDPENREATQYLNLICSVMKYEYKEALNV